MSLRDLVFAAMDNAVTNGYGNMMRHGAVETVAIDMLDCDAEIEKLRPSVKKLTPHIEAWREKRKS